MSVGKFVGYEPGEVWLSTRVNEPQYKFKSSAREIDVFSHIHQLSFGACLPINEVRCIKPDTKSKFLMHSVVPTCNSEF